MHCGCRREKGDTTRQEEKQGAAEDGEREHAPNTSLAATNKRLAVDESHKNVYMPWQRMGMARMAKSKKSPFKQASEDGDRRSSLL